MNEMRALFTLMLRHHPVAFERVFSDPIYTPG